MSFQDAVSTHFPGAILGRDFVHRSHQALLRHGFSADRAIACVGVCRDEVTRPLVDEIERVWGPPFTFSGLLQIM